MEPREDGSQPSMVPQRASFPLFRDEYLPEPLPDGRLSQPVSPRTMRLHILEELRTSAHESVRQSGLDVARATGTAEGEQGAQASNGVAGLDLVGDDESELEEDCPRACRACDAFEYLCIDCDTIYCPM